jgi:hypothetical protein
MIVVALVYRTPFPVQPMKAIGTVAATQVNAGAVLGPDAYALAALLTGVAWLAIAASGTLQRLSRLVSRPLAFGIVLGLGIALMLEASNMMAGNWRIAAPALFGTFEQGKVLSRPQPASPTIAYEAKRCGAEEGERGGFRDRSNLAADFAAGELVGVKVDVRVARKDVGQLRSKRRVISLRGIPLAADRTANIGSEGSNEDIVGIVVIKRRAEETKHDSCVDAGRSRSMDMCRD